MNKNALVWLILLGVLVYPSCALEEMVGNGSVSSQPVSDPVSPLQTAEQALSAGQYETALQNAKEFQEKFPQNVTGIKILAQIYLAEGRYHDALTWSSQVFTVAPWDPEVLRLKGLSLFYTDQYDAALELINQSVLIEPMNATGWGYRALVLQEQGYPEMARKNADMALLLDSGEMNALRIVEYDTHPTGSWAAATAYQNPGSSAVSGNQGR
jgi:predicted Zn-dependent protease